MFFLQEYQKKRILTLFDPESDALGAGWNIIQSKIAIGSGGLTARFTEGTQSHLGYLPEHHTDFIMSTYAEEFGFIGVFAVQLIRRHYYPLPDDWHEQLSQLLPPVRGRDRADFLFLCVFKFGYGQRHSAGYR